MTQKMIMNTNILNKREIGKFLTLYQIKIIIYIHFVALINIKFLQLVKFKTIRITPVQKMKIGLIF